MTPARLEHCLDRIGWTQRELGRRCGVNERQVRRWVAGATIPERLSRWIERVAAWHNANPAPEKNVEAA